MKSEGVWWGGAWRPPLPSLVSVPRHIISTPFHPPPSHPIYPHLSKMKNPSLSSNVPPNMIHTSFPEIEPYLGATGFAICFQISFVHELYFPSTSDQNYTPIDRVSGHRPSTYTFLYARGSVLSAHVRGSTCARSAAERNLNAAVLM